MDRWPICSDGGGGGCERAYPSSGEVSEVGGEVLELFSCFRGGRVVLIRCRTAKILLNDV